MSKRDEGQVIQEDGSEPSHYAMIPKMAMMELEPFELSLYCQYKMTASEHGKCWKSNKTLATESGMSERRMRDARDLLEKRGYITVSHTPDEHGHINSPPTITINNVWTQNRLRYAKKEAVEGVAPHAKGVAGGARGVAPHATKESVLKKNVVKKGNAPQRTHPLFTIKYPSNVHSYTIKHIQAYQEEHLPEMVALVKSWAGEMFASVTEFGKHEGQMYIEVHQELARLKIDCTDYPTLATYAKTKNKWKSDKGDKVWVKCMLDYVTEYKPTPQPIATPSTPTSAKLAHDYEEMFGAKH